MRDLRVPRITREGIGLSVSERGLLNKQGYFHLRLKVTPGLDHLIERARALVRGEVTETKVTRGQVIAIALERGLRQMLAELEAAAPGRPPRAGDLSLLARVLEQMASGVSYAAFCAAFHGLDAGLAHEQLEALREFELSILAAREAFRAQWRSASERAEEARRG